MSRGHAFGGIVVALVLAATAVAQEYSFRFYGPAEGLQNLVVLSLAQDHSGYIWVGTEGGLYRYDGSRFLLMGQAEGLPCSTEVHGVFVASDGALWVNTCAELFRFDGQRFEVIPGISRLLRDAQVMADGTRGSVLVTTPAGIYEVSRGTAGSFATRPYPISPVVAGKPAYGIARQGARVWFGCAQQLCVEQDGQLSVFGREQELPEDSWDAIQIAPDGTVWARSPKSLYARAAGQTKFSNEMPEIASSGFWGALTVARDGSIMVPTDRGLVIHTKDGWSVINRLRGLRKENTAAVLEDREGSVWIGLPGGGLARWIGRGVWESWKMEQGLPSDIVWNIRRDRRGELWVGTSLGLARIDASGRVSTWTTKDGLGSDNVRWLAETSDGSIWAASKPGGLARMDPSSARIHRVGARDGLPCDPEDVFVDREDRLWLPTRCGLYVNERPSVSDHVIRVVTPESFGSSAWKLVEDTHGTIWVTNGTALWSLRQGRWRKHGRAEGLLTDHPYALAAAADGSIWLRHRYDGGIDRLEVSDDRILRASAIVPAYPKQGPATSFQGFDAFGNFWRGTTNGAAVLHGGKWTTFTTEDGLVSNDCDGEAFWADADGSVWLGTSGGLAHHRAQGAAPSEPLVADPTITRMDIEQTRRVMRAEFSSLNYKAEQLVRFAYRLDDAPWTDTVERSISIGGLGPGRHRLEVRSRVRDGPFSPQIASVGFSLEPRWHETWWAHLLALGCALAVLYEFVRWRLHAAVQTQSKLEAIIAARTMNLSQANRSLDEAARQLRRSEDRLKHAERLAHVGHWDWNVKTNQLSWSEEMYRIFARERETAPTYEEFVQAVVSEDRGRFQEWIRECLAKKSGGSLEFQISRPNGDLRSISCTSELSVDEESSPARMFGACHDMTDARRAQQEDLARQKLESVGVLAGGIAHDFNNLLGGVLAQAELALEQTGAYPEEQLEAIRNVALRGTEIVRQLMVYAGQEHDVPGAADVAQIIPEILGLLKVSVSKRVTLTIDLGSDLPVLRATPAQVQQVVVNLVSNASDAIGDQNGVIRITVRRAPSELAAEMTRGAAGSDYLLLEVSDTGCGMSLEMQGKVFDPFFSTKGAGHGLGLAVVHGIVRRLGGAVQISSEAGRGTTFQVLLPCADTAVPQSVPPFGVSGNQEQPCTSRTVLVVEDEEVLREAVTRILRKRGFTVLEAGDGTCAIDLLRANGGNIDVILLDMTIPGASSQEVIAEAAEVQQNVGVILTSAYSREMLTPLMSASHILGFIRKPYRLGDLVQSIQKAASWKS